MKQTFIALVILLTFNVCKAQEDSSKRYNHFYTIAEIPNKKAFLARIDAEGKSFGISTMIDSLIQRDTSLREAFLRRKNEILSNQGLLIINDYTNSKRVQSEDTTNNGVPAQCQCLVHEGKMTIIIGAGFFGGMGVEVELVDSSFHSSYFMYIDEVKPFKASPKDSFTDNLKVKSKYQYLILDDKPTFEEGQQLTGYLTFTSSEYYQRQYSQQLDKNYVEGKIYFTCITKRKLNFDR